MVDAYGAEMTQAGTTVRVALSGDLDPESMHELIAECIERMRLHHATSFVFDMSEVSYIGSACIGPLVELVQELEHVRGRVAMVNCPDHVARLFKITGLDKVFAVDPRELETWARV